jgi:hypothetical protein
VGLQLTIALTFDPGRCSYPPTAEELTEQFASFAGQHAALDPGSPMAGRLVEHARPVDDGTALGVVGSPDHPTDSGMTDGPRTHGAWLKRHIKCEISETIVSEGSGSRP